MKKILSMVLIAAISALVGCTNSSGSSGAPMNASQIGIYQPANSSVGKPRVGITVFKVEADPTTLASNANLGEYAADQLGELLEKSGRFTIVKRTDFSSMLDRQNHADIVRPGALVRPANIDGVDYIVVGTISNLSVSKRVEQPGMMDKIGDFVRQSSDNKQVMVTVTCGVGFSIVDPGTNDIVIANSSELNRTAPAAELGIDVLPGSIGGDDPRLPISPDDREKVIRFALDDAVKKSLAKIDRFLESRPADKVSADKVSADKVPAANFPAPVSHDLPAPTNTSPTNAAPTNSTPAPVVAHVICPTCGAENDASAKFCKKCGAKLK